jgi:acyl dehydratase
MERIGDICIGHKIRSQRRTISEGEFTAMVNLSWESGPLHSDREYAKTTIFGERILGGPCIIPFVAGLSGRALHGMWERAGAVLIALVGMENVRFTAPLYPGDTICLESEVAEFRRTSKTERFIVRIHDVLQKQDGRTILEMDRLVLLREGSSPEAHVSSRG